MTPWGETLVQVAARLGISSRVHELEINPSAGGFLGTNEVLPDRFCDEVRAAFQPSGYLVGAGCGRYSHGIGCGNILSLLPAFAAPPRGLILVDPDPAVVCGLEMVAEGLARHATAEDFVAALVCGGRAALQQSEERVRRRYRECGLALPDEASRQRLWRGLHDLTAGFTRQPADAPRLAAEWGGAEPAPGGPIPVWTHLVRSYPALHALACAGAFVVVRSSVLDPAFIAAVSSLPGFERGGNVIYLANIADYEIRRILFASARQKLGLAAGGDEPELATTPEFVAHLNAELEGLRALSGAPGRAVFVATSETHDLRLAASAQPPRYRAADFFLQIDLHSLASRLFEDPGAASETKASALLDAAFQGDRDRAAALLERLAFDQDAAPLAAAGDRVSAAVRLADLGEALWLVQARGLAPAAPDRLRRLIGEIRGAADRLGADLAATPAAALPVPEALLLAHALAVASRVLGDPGLAGISEDLARAGLAAVSPESAVPFGLRAEALFRLLRFTLHRPLDAASAAVGRGVAALLAAIDSTGTLVPEDAGPEPAARGSYESAALSAERVARTVRLLLFFYGLKEEALDPVRAALLLRRVAVAAPRAVVS